MKRAVADGAIAGLALAIVECLAVFALGSAPRIDGPVIVAFDLLLGLGAALVAEIVARALRGGAGADRVRRGLLICLLFAPLALRSPYAGMVAVADADWAPTLRWGVVGGLLLMATRISPKAHAAWTFARRCLLAAAVVVLSVTLRSMNPDTLVPALEQGGPLRLIAIAASLLALIAGVALPARTVCGLMERVGATPTILGGVLAGLGWVALVAAPDPGTQSTPSRTTTRDVSRPNVVLVVLDTVRADHLSVYGYPRPTSPYLEAFSRHATRFTFAHSTAPYTLASHASMFTGLLPSEHGAHRVPRTGSTPPDAMTPDDPLDPAAPTIAEELRRRGYRTGAIVANTAYLSPWTGLARGFDDYRSRPWREYGFVPVAFSVASRVWPALVRGEMVKGLDAGRVTNRAIAWIRGAEALPFFLFVNYFDAHAPYRRNLSPSDRSKDEAVDRYDGEIAYMDRELARLISWIDARGLGANTLVIITSDHGEGFGEHGCREHCNSLYEELLHVPLLVRLPGQTAPLVSGTAVSLQRIPQMIRQGTSGERDPGVFAHTLAAAGSGLSAEHWFSALDASSCPSAQRGPVIRALYEDRMKLVQTTVDEELYDLRSDPGEERNLFRVEPDRARAARDALTLGAGAAPPLTEIAGARHGGSTQGPDAATRDRLRALGYIR